MPVTMEVTIDDAGIRQLMERLSRRITDLDTPMKLAAEHMKYSIDENFAVGGRPVPWIPSKRAMRQSGQTLVNKRLLQESITYTSSDGTVVIGTNVKYARIHQFGWVIPGGIILPRNGKALRWIGPDGKPVFRRKVNRPAITMPARPFLVVQDEDVTEIKMIIKDYLIGVKHGFK